MYTILLSAGWLIWPPLALSIVGLAILMERNWYLRQGHIALQAELELNFSLAEGMANGKAAPTGLIQDLRQNSVISTLLASVLFEKQAGHSAGQAIENLAVLIDTAWIKLERCLGAIAVIATLVVLIFLMVSTTFTRYNELAITLPTASGSNMSIKPQPITITMGRDGLYALSSKVINRSQLAASLGKIADPSAPSNLENSPPK